MNQNRIKLPISHELFKLELGCGNTIKDGYIGLDKGDYGQDIIWDMTKGIPLPDNSCSVIHCHSVLEHIGPSKDFITVMNECLRVLNNGGIMNVCVPDYSTFTAFKDPTHVRFFTKATFTYLEKVNTWRYGFDKRWIIESNEKKGDSWYVVLIANK